MACSGGTDMNGCPHADMCVSKTVARQEGHANGQECERTPCDMGCGHDEQRCETGYDMDGCPLASECRPMKNSYTDPATMETVECWPGCPMICGLDMMTCPGVSDACMGTTNNCVPKTVWGWHGQECERMSCDATCGPEEELCETGYDSDGCPLAKTCQPKTSFGWDAVTNTEVVCWSGCPTPCGPEQMSCDSMDANGCRMPGQCVDNQTPSINGDGTCYGFCPLDCGADMMPCPGGSDANGCEMQGTCVMMGDSCDTGYVAP